MSLQSCERSHSAQTLTDNKCNHQYDHICQFMVYPNSIILTHMTANPSNNSERLKGGVCLWCYQATCGRQQNTSSLNKFLRLACLYAYTVRPSRLRFCSKNCCGASELPYLPSISPVPWCCCVSIPSGLASPRSIGKSRRENMLGAKFQPCRSKTGAHSTQMTIYRRSSSGVL